MAIIAFHKQETSDYAQNPDADSMLVIADFQEQH